MTEFNIEVGSNEIVTILLTMVFLLLFMALSMLLFFRYARKKIIEKETEKSNLKLENQEKILQSTIETQEEERDRIAKDLHDAISAKLNVVSLHINMLLDNSLNVIEQQDALNKVLSITTNVLSNSRSIAHNLLPPILNNFGLIAAIEELFNEFEDTKTICINKSLVYTNCLSNKDELHFFRIIQELMNNSLKHGEATQIDVDLTDTPTELALNFNDNGKGFDIESTLLKTGLGLNNIKSRVAILKGDLYMESYVNQGSKFIVTINKKYK